MKCAPITRGSMPMVPGFKGTFAATIVPSAGLWAQEQAPSQPSDAAVADTVSKANNPIASMNSLNLHNYYDPSLYSIPSGISNTMMLRGAIVAGRQIIRATLPVATLPSGYEVYGLQPPTGPADAPASEANRWAFSGSAAATTFAARA